VLLGIGTWRFHKENHDKPWELGKKMMLNQYKPWELAKNMMLSIGSVFRHNSGARRFIPGWWFNHLEKYSSMGRIIPYIMENKKCSKPPTR